jgi:glycosyltransferase involved in cell wall biosynthesis
MNNPASVPRITYISWAESCSRSDHTARELGGSSHMIYAARFGSRASTVLFKYGRQWARTARVLASEKPEAVFVMSPPLFAALPAFWYAWRNRKVVVLDAHSGAFLNARWKRFQWMQNVLCRKAVATLVHNEHVAAIVEKIGGHPIAVPDVPIVFPEHHTYRRPDGFLVAVVCSFNYDEPVQDIFDAAAQLPDIQFRVTGNPKHLDPAVAAKIPSNVQLTGFLSTADYGALLRTADVVLTLTTNDHTMLRGAYEAIYQGTPVVVSDWPILRREFSSGARHVRNAAADIVAGVREIKADPQQYRAGAVELRRKKLERWGSVRAAIEQRLAASLRPRS